MNGGEELDGDGSADCGRPPLAPLVAAGYISEPANPAPSPLQLRGPVTTFWPGVWFPLKDGPCPGWTPGWDSGRTKPDAKV